MTLELQQLSDFIINGPSPYHAAAHAEKVLLEAGFIKLPFREDWKLEKGGRYYTFPFPTTLYAFSVGEHADFENHERFFPFRPHDRPEKRFYRVFKGRGPYYRFPFHNRGASVATRI